MKFFFLFIVIFQLFSCQKNDKKESPTTSNNITMDIPNCLQPQLMAGYSAEKSETDYPNYEYRESDLDCSIPLLEREDIEKAAKIYQEQEKDHDIWAGKDLRRKYERL